MTVEDSTETTDSLRIGSYNLRYAGLDEEPISWEQRRDDVAATISEEQPDAIALQECWMTQLPDLRERLPAYEWVGHPDENGEHTPIGYLPDRIAVESSDVFGLAPDGELGVTAWDADFPRVTTHATLRDRRTDRSLSLFSVHFDHRGSRAREESAKLVRDRLPDGPVVVAGDCNCRPESDPYGILSEPLTDTREVAETREGPSETFVGFGGLAVDEDGPKTAKTLDYIFVRGFDVTTYRVVDSADDPEARASDHRLVVTDLVATGSCSKSA